MASAGQMESHRPQPEHALSSKMGGISFSPKKNSFKKVILCEELSPEEERGERSSESYLVIFESCEISSSSDSSGSIPA